MNFLSFKVVFKCCMLYVKWTSYLLQYHVSVRSFTIFLLVFSSCADFKNYLNASHESASQQTDKFLFFLFFGINIKYSYFDAALFFLISFFGSPSTVGLFSRATLKYGLVVWQALRGTLLSSWNVCLFATIAIFAALICQLGAFSLTLKKKNMHTK